MPISVKTLYKDVAQELGLGEGNERLTDDFPRAVNRALSEMSHAADLATKITHVSSCEDSINLDANYEYIIYAGTTYYLTRAGHKPKDPRIAPTIYEDTSRRWKDAKADYVVAEDNLKQSDSTFEMIGLGIAQDS
jgi:hypothetical protein